MLNNNDVYKYEIPYKGTLLITQFCTNGMVTLQCGEIKIRYNIRRINTYTSAANVEDINPEKDY